MTGLLTTSNQEMLAHLKNRTDRTDGAKGADGTDGTV